MGRTIGPLLLLSAPETEKKQSNKTASEHEACIDERLDTKFQIACHLGFRCISKRKNGGDLKRSLPVEDYFESRSTFLLLASA
jgi:hypothetical protein